MLDPPDDDDYNDCPYDDDFESLDYDVDEESANASSNWQNSRNF